MATLTRLASTLTAKYFPSQTLTDAFYIDGRLFGKRETRQADITIDKEERGFFFSVFAHPRIPEYEPGMMPPYEPELRHTINEVKFGRKEIDSMIEGFLTTAVDVTGKMKLADSDSRSPYFAGIIVRDAEAFAVTIGNGLAFLYRDDTLFPLTDAGIPMEPIDANGDRVGDFLYYCSSKTANALWSNFFTLSPDDCIILCNKEIYDALGQREILRILNDAEDQCDAAGVIITQASARMPGVPMQFSISFVESVTSDEKRGLFGFRKKNKEEDTSDMSVKSTLDGGVVGAAASAAADAGFTGGLAMTDAEDINGTASLLFGDNAKGPAAPVANQQASADKGFEVGDINSDKAVNLDFPETKGTVEEISAEDMMKSLFGAGAAGAATAATAAAASAAGQGTAAATAVETSVSAPSEGSPFVSAFNPFDMAEQPSQQPEMKTVSETAFEIPAEDDSQMTKPVERLDSEFLQSLQKNNSIKKDGIIEAAIKEMGGDLDGNKNEEIKGEPMEQAFVMPEPEPAATETSAPVVENEEEKKAEPEIPSMSESGELVFTEASVSTEFGGMVTPSAEEEFNPYSVGSGEEMQNAAPLVFGDDGTAPAPDFTAPADDGIDVPEYRFNAEKPVLTDDDKLPVDFPADIKPEDTKTPSSAAAAVTAAASAGVASASKAVDVQADDGFSLPFANQVETIPEEKPVTPVESDIPDMPLYNANSYDTPVAAVSSEQPVNSNPEDVYTYGQYRENENMADDSSYQSFGSEGNNYSDFSNNGADAYGYHNEDINYGQAGTEPVGPGDDISYGEAYNDNDYQAGGYAAPDGYTDPGYSQAAAEGYTDFASGNSYGDYGTDAYDSNSAAYGNTDSASAGGDDWINGILGLDGTDSGYAATTAGATAAAASAGYAAAGGASARPSSSRPGGPGRSNAQRRPGAAGNGNGGRGGHGKKRKFPKLNRNGYIFLAFVLIMLICFIILIAVIAKACSKDEEPADTEPTTTPVEVIQTETPIVAEPTPSQNSQTGLEPIGIFYFSDDIGYKCWWDLFNKVYDIQLLSESDEHVQTIIDYNNYYCAQQGISTTIPAGYKPAAGDQIILPPSEVIAGTVAIPDTASATQNAGNATVNGTIGVVDGSATTEAAQAGTATTDPAQAGTAATDPAAQAQQTTANTDAAAQAAAPADQQAAPAA